MRNYVKLILGTVLLLLFTGCTAQSKPDPSAIKIYYTNSGKTKLVEETVTAESKEQNQLIEELLGKLKEQPKNAECFSAIPKEAQMNGYSVDGQRLTLDFSESYQSLDKVAEVLMRAAIVKTLIQVEGLKEVTFQVNGSALLDELGEEVGVMNADTFIDTKGQGINSYQYASLTLYFPTSEGDKIAKEMRNVHYSTNTAIERVVIDQLIAGPANPNLKPLFPAETKVNSVTIANSICAVNFDESIQTVSSDNSISPQAVLYSIVNSLADVCGVSKVQFQIGGKSLDVAYRSISLSEPFVKNEDIIYQVDGSLPASDAQKTEVMQAGAGEKESDGNNMGDQSGTEGVTEKKQQGTSPENEKEDENINSQDTNMHEPAIGIDPDLQNETQ